MPGINEETTHGAEATETVETSIKQMQMGINILLLILLQELKVTLELKQ